MTTCTRCKHELASHEIWATDLGGTLACQVCGCMYSPIRETMISIRKQREGLCIRGCPTCKGTGEDGRSVPEEGEDMTAGDFIGCLKCGGSGLLNTKVQIPTEDQA